MICLIHPNKFLRTFCSLLLNTTSGTPIGRQHPLHDLQAVNVTRVSRMGHKNTKTILVLSYLENRKREVKNDIKIYLVNRCVAIIYFDILRVQPTRCNVPQFIYFCKTFYMFQTCFPSIIRSSKLHIQTVTATCC